MRGNTIGLLLFCAFALGLPLYGMQTNEYGGGNTHQCIGECYEQWKDETGGVVNIAQAQAQTRAEASPEELGRQAYNGCVACHGADGEGGVGPQLAGQGAAQIATALQQYKNGETRGAQSSLMWSQSAALSDSDIDNLAAFIESL